ncbi:Hypothetical predicted protein [Octopus vulgaris]|uniref:Uncharacterized protein n=1 Tax=Octopus vulgaris TaxID=6645 RepID=A0AA36C1J4_OCTVU|nr:Hypothetical predicted protein [Octopus vulgaris]
MRFGNKLIMTNIYADKMRFGNKRNKCDVVCFVNGNHVNKDIEDSSNINSTSSEIDYEGRIGMTNSRDNHNNDVGDDISDYNDYQGGNNSVNCSDNGNTNISKNKNKNDDRHRPNHSSVSLILLNKVLMFAMIHSNLTCDDIDIII